MRVVVTSPPLAGHVHPLVPFGQALQQAGHDVTLAVAAGMAESLVGTGLRLLAIAPPDIGQPQVDVVAELAQFMNWSRGFAPVLLEHCRDLHADVVVHDTYDFAGPAVAEVLGVPAVAHACTFRPPRAAQRAGWTRGWGAMRADLGLSEDPELARVWSSLYLDPVPASLYPPPMRPLPVARPLRPSVFDQTGDEGLPSEVAELPDRPTVYATLGTVFNHVGLLRTIVEALAGEDVNLVLTTGRNVDPGDLGPLPSNALVRRYIPQSLLLPRVDAVVTHTGFNTVVAALTSGLPMVCLPLGADHPITADRLAALGAGVNCAPPLAHAPRGSLVDPERLDAAVVRDGVRAVLSHESYRAVARDLRDEIAAMPSPAEAVALVESLTV